MYRLEDEVNLLLVNIRGHAGDECRKRL